MASSAKADWLVPAGLIALSVIPVIAGTARVVQLASGVAMTPENARFVTAPLPVVLHIIGVTLYSVLGAFQFSTGFRKRNPGWHRVMGRILVPAGLMASLTGLWMTQFYEWPKCDGVYLYLIRLVVGSAMTVALVRGVTAILRRDIQNHRAWMMRAYALGLGAGTQVFTHIPYFVLPDIQGELSRTVCMAAAWVINLAVAEWLITRQRRRPEPVVAMAT